MTQPGMRITCESQTKSLVTLKQEKEKKNRIIIINLKRKIYIKACGGWRGGGGPKNFT